MSDSCQHLCILWIDALIELNEQRPFGRENTSADSQIVRLSITSKKPRLKAAHLFMRRAIALSKQMLSQPFVVV